MTAYSSIAAGEIDPESPVTTTLVQRLRDNPLAIAEGDATAPRIWGGALQTGMGAQFLTDSVGPLTWVVNARVACIGGHVGIRNPVAVINGFRAAYSADGGATFGTTQVMASLSADEDEVGYLRLSLETGVWCLWGFMGGGTRPQYAAGTHGVPAGCNAVQLTISAKRAGSPLTEWGWDPFILSGRA
jgi:hypothetical protein